MQPKTGDFSFKIFVLEQIHPRPFPALHRYVYCTREVCVHDIVVKLQNLWCDPKLKTLQSLGNSASSSSKNFSHYCVITCRYCHPHSFTTPITVSIHLLMWCNFQWSYRLLRIFYCPTTCTTGVQCLCSLPACTPTPTLHIYCCEQLPPKSWMRFQSLRSSTFVKL